MKNWIIYLMIGLLIGGSIGGVYQYVNKLNERLDTAIETILVRGGEYGKLLEFSKERDEEVKKLKVALSVSETEKLAAQESLKTLNWQFKDATRESIRVEGNLTERLNEADAETKSLKATLNNEVASKKILADQLQEANIKIDRENKRALANLDLYWSVSKDLQWEAKNARKLEEEKAVLNGQLGIAKKLVEGTLLMATGQPIKAGSKTVKSVVVIPADISVSIVNIDALKSAIEKTCTMNQLWFFVQVGESFSCQEPIVVRGKKTLKEYDQLAPEYRIFEIRKEIGAFYGKETFALFLWGSTDRNNYGGTDSILIPDVTIKLIVDGDSRGWGIVAHELGHAWDLPHLVTENKLAIMRVDATGYAEGIDFFPFAILTDGEEDIVRRNLTK